MVGVVVLYFISTPISNRKSKLRVFLISVTCTMIKLGWASHSSFIIHSHHCVGVGGRSEVVVVGGRITTNEHHSLTHHKKQNQERFVLGERNPKSHPLIASDRQTNSYEYTVSSVHHIRVQVPNSSVRHRSPTCYRRKLPGRNK